MWVIVFQPTASQTSSWSTDVELTPKTGDVKEVEDLLSDKHRLCLRLKHIVCRWTFQFGKVKWKLVSVKETWKQLSLWLSWQSGVKVMTQIYLKMQMNVAFFYLYIWFSIFYVGLSSFKINFKMLLVSVFFVFFSYSLGLRKYNQLPLMHFIYLFVLIWRSVNLKSDIFNWSRCLHLHLKFLFSVCFQGDFDDFGLVLIIFIVCFSLLMIRDISQRQIEEI